MVTRPFMQQNGERGLLGPHLHRLSSLPNGVPLGPVRAEALRPTSEQTTQAQNQANTRAQNAPLAGGALLA